MTPDDNYVRRATVQRVVDGDTVALDVDLGFWTHEFMLCRLVGLNARELRDPGGKEARDHLAEMLPAGKRVTVSSIKADKYAGRFDGVIFTLPTEGSIDVNAQMIHDGYAAVWDGTGTKPVPPWPILEV
jgi:micrococcal nuclease